MFIHGWGGGYTRNSGKVSNLMGLYTGGGAYTQRGAYARGGGEHTRRFTVRSLKTMM